MRDETRSFDQVVPVPVPVLARACGVQRATVYRWIQIGYLAVRRLADRRQGERRYLIHPEEAQRVMRAQRAVRGEGR